jgi:hypothetical protein
VSTPDAEPATKPVVPAQPGPAAPAPGARFSLSGRPVEEDDRPLPDLPPLPEDPGWRLAHLPMVVAAGLALVFCAATIGFVTGGPTAALGAATGVFVVGVGLTMSTLVIAWADAVRPELIMPLGLLAYVIKFALISVMMMTVAANGWAGGLPMAWGIAGGVVALTAVQVWWVSRLDRRSRVSGSAVDR